jgi:TPR repeat protein
VPKDPAEAVKWYRKAAEQGDAHGQNLLAGCYVDGIGVSKDPAEAVKWYRKSAEQNFTDSQFSLGTCYLLGAGVPKDAAEGMKWYRKAAELGAGRGCQRLAFCYQFGHGVGTDGKKAIEWYRKAVDAGFVSACADLGYCCEAGVGGPANEAEADRWFLKGAELGDLECQIRIGQRYVYGEGGLTDLAEAIKWLRKAGEQANSPMERRRANHNLALAYRRAGLQELGRGNTDGAAGLLKEAVRLAEQVQKASPGRFQSENELARASAALGRYHDAVKEFDKAAASYQKAVDPKFGVPRAFDRLAEMYENGTGVAADKKKAEELRDQRQNCYCGFGKWFTVTGVVEDSGRRIHIPMYILGRRPDSEKDFLKLQELWWRDEGMVIEPEDFNAFMRLVAIAKENNVSFLDLYVYAKGEKGKALPED